MQEQLSLEQAADALSRHYGGKGLESGREDGLALMSDALRQEAGISKEQADKLIQGLNDANLIHWVARGIETSEPEKGVEETVPGTVERPAGHVIADLGAQGYWIVGKPGRG